MYSLKTTEHGKKNETSKGQKETEEKKVFKVNADKMEHKVYLDATDVTERKDQQDKMDAMEKMY